jgi:hypothetical protein
VPTPSSNPVLAENALPGTPNWQIPSALRSTSSDLTHLIEGYANLTSVNKGDPITFYVNVQPVQSYSINIYRLGWYQGIGARLLQQVSGLNGVAQPACPPDPTTGLIECAWSPSYTLTVPPTWTTGVYIARLDRQDGYAGYMIFVVRDDTSTAPYLFQSSVTTFEAYNSWGGKSLYGSSGATEYVTTDRAYQVSFDRPYTYYRGAAEFLQREYPMVRWLEHQGYNVAYATDIDTHEQPAMLLQHRAFLSVGHDEYWSKQMRDNVEAALHAGVSLGFFGGNEMYWNIRLGPSPLGPDRIITCYKSASLDPLAASDPSDATVQWAQPPLNRPENAVTGMNYGGTVQNYVPGYSLVVTNSSAWPYAGANVADGTVIPQMVGYEYDQVVNNGNTPPGLIVLASSSVTKDTGQADVANTTVYTALSGAIVFTAGTVQWDYGLDPWTEGPADPRIQQITANVLARMATAP